MIFTLAEVISLTWHNFDDYNSKVVKFYAPWCGHCKALAPEFIKLSELNNITCGEVDCTVEGRLCKKFGIEGYPSIKVFINGQVFDYEGERKVEALQLYVEAMQRPALVLDYPVNEEEYFLVMYTEDIGRDEVLFSDLKGKMELTARSGNQRLIAFIEGLEIGFEGRFVKSEIEEFGFMYKHGFFPEMTPSIFQELSMRTLAVFVHSSSEEFGNLQKQAHSFPRHLLNYAHLDGEQWGEYLTEFKCFKLPCAIFLDEYLKYGREIASEDDFMKVVNLYESGELKSANGKLAAVFEEIKDLAMQWLQSHSEVAETLIVAGILIVVMFLLAIPLMVLIVRCCSRREAKLYSNVLPDKRIKKQPPEKAANAVRETTDQVTDTTKE